MVQVIVLHMLAAGQSVATDTAKHFTQTCIVVLQCGVVGVFNAHDVSFRQPTQLPAPSHVFVPPHGVELAAIIKKQ